MKKQAIYILLLGLLSLGVFSCFPTRKIKENEHLITKNKVIVEGYKGISSDDLSGFIRQKHNKRLLGIYPKLGIYNFSVSGKQGRFRTWVGKKFGEEPVILDTNITNTTCKQMLIFLNNSGYFNSEITTSVDTARKKINNAPKKKIKVVYHAKILRPYTIRNFTRTIQDKAINSIVLNHDLKCKIIEGNIFNSDDLDDERNRIAKIIKDYGYHFYSSEYIRFNVDSNLNSHQLDVEMVFNDFYFKSKISPDSILSRKHIRYKVKNVYVNMDFNMSADLKPNYDTLVVKKDTFTYYIVYTDELAFKPKNIIHNISVFPEQYYTSISDEATYKSLNELRNFRNISIKYVPVNTNFSELNEEGDYLNCFVNLTHSSKQDYKFEVEGTHTGGDLGIQAGVNYNNKNLFKGAEHFSLGLTGGLEFQHSENPDPDDNIIDYGILQFNTLEFGGNMSFEIPRIPINTLGFQSNKYINQKMKFNLGYDHQRRPDYTRDISKATFGVSWRTINNHSFNITLADLNYVKIHPDSLFQITINQMDDQNLKNSYSDHFITSFFKPSYLYSNQKLNKIANFDVIRLDFETSGLLLSSIFKAVGADTSLNGNYELFNVKYAQYVRGKLDYRHYHYFSREQVLATRISTGIGLPYWNSSSLPFEKMFYVGGSNSIRAWMVRSLGPGSTSSSENTSIIEKTGDISLEFSFEYRFPIYEMVKGAFFIDGGNIWLLDKEKNNDVGTFQWNEFYNEIAIGAGFGIRLDITYFVIRVDYAVKVKDPSMKKGERFVIQDLSTLKSGNLNFGIGYPF